MKLHLFDIVWRLIVVLLLCSLPAVTIPKLYKMCAIKGWLPGAQVHTYRVTQKLKEKDELGDAYWIAWTEEDIRRRGNHRTNLTGERWASIHEGDPIEIITVGRDPSPYVRDDIFVEPGNFVFDAVLLTAELGGITVVVWAFARRWSRASHTQSSSTI